MKVSVIFATYNREDVLEAAFNNWRIVRDNTKYDFEIICSDDASTDRTVDIIKAAQRDLPIKLIQNPKGGAGKARNAALKIAKGEVIIFTGDDIFPNPYFINQHYENYLKFGEKVATLGRIDWHHGIKINHLMKHITEIGCEQFSFIALPVNQIVDFRHFYTSNISVSKKMLDEVNVYFRGEFDKYGFEDIELGYRLQKTGMRIYYDPAIIVEHYHIYDSAEKFCMRQRNAGEEMVVFGDLHEDLHDKCFYDIDNCRKSMVVYLSKKKSTWSFRGKIVLLMTVLAKRLTKTIEDRMKKSDTIQKQKMCSVLYLWLFQFYFAYGLAERIACNQNLKPSAIADFAIRYRMKPYAQIYEDIGHGFSEVHSRKWFVWKDDFQILDMELSDNVKKIRVTPMKNQCVAWIKGIYFITKDGERKTEEPIWHNARERIGMKYDFRNTNDPCIIFENISSEYKKIRVEIKTRNRSKYKIASKLKSIGRTVYRIIARREKHNLNSVDTIEYSYGQPRKIQIGVDLSRCVLERDIISEYRKQVAVFGENVVISEANNMEEGYINYLYAPINRVLDPMQMMQAVYTLKNQAFDYVFVPCDNSEVCKENLDDLIIYSDLLFGETIERKIKCAQGKKMVFKKNILKNDNILEASFDNMNVPEYLISRHHGCAGLENPVIFLIINERIDVNLIDKIVNDLRKNGQHIVCMISLIMQNENNINMYDKMEKSCDYIFNLFAITDECNYTKSLYDLKNIFNPSAIWLYENDESTFSVKSKCSFI